MDIYKQIIQRINAIEIENKVKILLAVESGSRAWGFASRDSDYDIRFVYARPSSWYLSILNRRDVIEYPIEKDKLDFSGWDIRKALQLFAKSNPPLLEWLHSPIIYQDIAGFKAEIVNLEKEFFSAQRCIYHYLHMAQGNYREYLKREKVRVKKYFYVLRPLLACEWIRNTNTPAPMEFGVLCESQLTENQIKNEIHKLLLRKTSGEELDVEPAIPLLNEYIEAKISYYSEYVRTLPKQRIEPALLDIVLQKYTAMVKE